MAGSFPSGSSLEVLAAMFSCDSCDRRLHGRSRLAMATAHKQPPPLLDSGLVIPWEKGERRLCQMEVEQTRSRRPVGAGLNGELKSAPGRDCWPPRVFPGSRQVSPAGFISKRQKTQNTNSAPARRWTESEAAQTCSMSPLGRMSGPNSPVHQQPCSRLSSCFHL